MSLETLSTRELMEIIAGPPPGWGARADVKILWGKIQDKLNLSPRSVRAASEGKESKRVRKLLLVAAQNRALEAACARLANEYVAEYSSQARRAQSLAGGRR